MSFFKKKYVPFLLLVAGGLAILFAFYSKALRSPDQSLFGSEGDGIKNYYTFAYHAKHDTSYVHFRGMNYPYGDLAVFADAQVAFSNAIRLLSNVYPAASSKAVGFMNFAMLISFLFCFIFLYLILVKVGLPRYYSILAAFAIGLLSPQIIRMYGHLGLTYCFFIPLIWLLTIMFFESKRRWLYTSLLFICSTILFFIHPYLGLISCVFMLVHWIVYLLQHKAERKKINILFIALQTVLPVILFHAFIALNDVHPDRPEAPIGMFMYNARMETIFIPNNEPFVGAVHTFWTIKGQSWEGLAYVGLTGVFIAFFSVIKLLRYIRRKQFRKILMPVLPEYLRTGIWVAVILLFFSMAYPFKLGMEFLLDLVPLVKQFRSLGRFAWVFYYVFLVYSVYTIYLMWRYLRSVKLRMMANTLLFITFALLFAEGIPYHIDAHKQITLGPNIFNEKHVPEPYKEVLKQIDPSQYQALIPIPFYHMGTEKHYMPGTSRIHTASQLISYHTGLPMMAASLSRTSLSESENILSIFWNEFDKTKLKERLPSRKPFLLVYSKEEITGRGEQEVVSKAKLLYSGPEVELYILSFEDIFGPEVKAQR